jgi:hypothetical protein
MLINDLQRLESSALYLICLFVLILALSFKTSVKGNSGLVTQVFYGFGGQLEVHR